MNARFMKTGLVAGALLLSLPLCAAAADTGSTMQPQKEIRDTAKAIKNDVQDARDKMTMDNIERKEDKQTVGEYIDDAAVTAKVKGKFVEQKGLDSLDIKVVTVDGTVTLMGDVKNSAQVGLAEEAAKQVEGVKTVNNELVVKD